MRYSRQREMITEIIKGRKDHPTADMIYVSCRNIDPCVSLGTVYRNLKLLTDEGEIITLETQDKRLHYDGDTSRHSHFICSFRVCSPLYSTLFGTLSKRKRMLLNAIAL